MNQNISQSPNALQRWSIPLATLLIAGVAAGAWVATRPAPATAAQTAKVSPEKPDLVIELGPADTATVNTRDFQTKLPVQGNLVPVSQALVKARISGTVQESLVQEGMAVKAGQILARIDSSDVAARVASQQAAVEEAQARLTMAKKNSANNQALLKQNYISQNAYDTSQNGVELAAANLKSARAQLEIARITQNDSVVRAPFSGIIAKRHLQTGDKAAPDMPMFSLVNLSEMTFEAQVPASDIARVKPGQDVQFQVDGFGERWFKGKIERINPTADAQSRSLLVYAKVDNADASLKGGMYARGSIGLEKSAATLVLPMAALRQQGNVDQVYLISNGQVLAQTVKLGKRNPEEGEVEVLQGLSAGQYVVLSKLDNLKPGSKVKHSGKVAAPATGNKG